MTLFNLKLLLRNLRNQKFSTILNLFGLSAGLTVVLLIAVYVNQQLRYDSFHQDSERIAMLTVDYNMGADQQFHGALSSAPMAFSLSNEIPEIESFVRINPWSSSKPVRHNDISFTERFVLFADSSFFEIFSFKFINGDSKNALNQPKSVVITETVAKRYFGEEDPIGEELILNNNSADGYTVTGVVENKTYPTHLPDFSMILSWETQGIPDDGNWLAQMGWISYFKLAENVDHGALYEKINDVKDKYMASTLEAMGGTMEFGLRPVRDVYLTSSDLEYFPFRNGSKQQITQLGAIALFILLIAGLNFINLSTAKSFTRARQIGICKTLGSSRRKLVGLFLFESTLISLLSMVFAVLGAWIALPYFSDMVGVKLYNALFMKPFFILLLISLTMSVGLLAGLYPAIYLTRFKPISVIRNQMKYGVKGKRLRSSMVVLQFTISIVLVICTLVVMQQLNFIRTMDLGFDKENVMLVKLPNRDIAAKAGLICDKVRNLPGVISATSTEILPNEITGISAYHVPETPYDNQIFISFQDVGYDFIDVFDIGISDGRNFSREMTTDLSEAIIINKTAQKKLGWENAVGQELNEILSLDPLVKNTFKVIAVVDDYHFNTIHNEIEPLLLKLGQTFPNMVCFKLSDTDYLNTVESIEEIWSGFFPDITMNTYYMDRIHENYYRKEVRLESVYRIFTILAVLIASLGLVALALFSAEQRVLEIGIRKTLGATPGSLMYLLTSDYLKLVLIANVIAWPIGFYCMKIWLDNYAYHAPFGWWLYPLAGFGAMLIATLTVSGLVAKYVNVNPASIMRSE